MLYAIINRWLSAITFLSDKERMVCSELLAILLLGVFVYAVAKLVKFFLHLLLKMTYYTS